MNNYKYVVEIQKEQGKLTGVIVAHDNRINFVKKQINLTTFLFDLNEGLDTDNPNLDKRLIDTKFIYFMEFILEYLKSGDLLDLYNIEKAKVAFGVDLNYVIYHKVAIQKTRASEKTLEWVRYCPSLKPGESIIQQNKPHKFVYCGDNLISVVLAFCHYLTMHDYKPTQCKHCGKMFFTQNLKNTLCERITPYTYLLSSGEEKKYSLENKSCREAVKTIKDRFRHRKSVLVRSYDEYYEADTSKQSRAFQIGALKYMEVIKKEPSAENLKAYEEFLYIHNLTRRERNKQNSKE